MREAQLVSYFLTALFFLCEPDSSVVGEGREHEGCCQRAVLQCHVYEIQTLLFILLRRNILLC